MAQLRRALPRMLQLSRLRRLPRTQLLPARCFAPAGLAGGGAARRFCDAPAETPATPKRGGGGARRRVGQLGGGAKSSEPKATDPFSLTGAFILTLGVGMCYLLTKVDSMVTSSFHSKKHIDVTIDQLIEKRKKDPFVAPPENWTRTDVLINHIKNIGSNSESLWSALYRSFTVPSKQLLPKMRGGIIGNTLVVDINAIAYSAWSREKSSQKGQQSGYVRKIRDGWMDLLKMLVMDYRWEVVLWSGEEMMDWEQDLAMLDPVGYTQGMYLWGKDCYYYNSYRCKNIDRLGRPRGKVVVLETNAMQMQLQPRNAITVQPFDGKDGDTTIDDYGEFLLYLATCGAEDVRTVLDKYRNKEEGFLAAWSADMEEMYSEPEPVPAAASFGRGRMGSVRVL